MPAAPDPSGPQETAELAGRLRLAVTRLARLMRQQADTGLSPTLLVALASVEATGPLTLGELAAREQVSPPTVTKVVAGLEDQGLVVRRIDAADRRVARVEITPEGRRLLERSRTRKNAWLARRLGALEPAERARLAAALEALECLTADGHSGGHPRAPGHYGGHPRAPVGFGGHPRAPGAERR